MKEELEVYKEIVEAIKIAKSNMDLENDMTNLDIDMKVLESELVNDEEIKNKAKEKVYKK